MTSLTVKEKTVYDAIKITIEENSTYCVDVEMISWNCDLSESQIKGCISALLKKGMVGEVEPKCYEAY